MKKEKDPRINVRNWSIEHYLSIVLGLAAVNGFYPILGKNN